MNLFRPFGFAARKCCEVGSGPATEPGVAAYSIAIAGNPNCGKTTLFNALTGARQKVGNWPGVTVDRKAGRFVENGTTVSVVDLPGVYSLAVAPGSGSIDERIARDYILSGEPDVIVNIVDATNLERHLYLTAQLLEMRVPMVVALNMTDVAEQLGIEVDVAALAQRLGCPVVSMAAALGRGIDALKTALNETARTGHAPTQTVAFGPVLEPAIARLVKLVDGIAGERGLDARWLAVKLLEGEGIARRVTGGIADLMVGSLTEEFKKAGAEDPDVLVADSRFGFAHRVAAESVRRRGHVSRTTSDTIDQVVLHRWAGPLIFFAVIYAMFLFTINLGGAFIDFFDIAFGTVFVEGTRVLMTAIGAPMWLTALAADGLGGGIQIVATFIPIIGFLYLFLSALEDSGYMARAAFLTDRFMRAVGLPGKAFVPLIVGFGCNVPAIMASRTLENARDRIVTVVMAPFMSCGARLAVYALFAAAFFPTGGQNVVFALYLIGIAAAIGTGMIVKRTLLTGDTTPFIMELPGYHVPRPRDVLIQTWNRLKVFIFGAGKVIVLVVMVLSFFNSLGTDGTFGNQDSEKSSLSAVGRAIVPVFEPMGIHEDNWPATVGIFTGVFAKEAVVGTLNTLYSGLSEADADAGDAKDGFDFVGGFLDALVSIPANLAGLAGSVLDPLGLSSARLQAVAEEQGMSSGSFGAMVERFHGPAAAFAYMLFILLYTPCAATMGAMAREVGAKWSLFVAGWTLGLAYGAATIAYQTVTLVDHPLSSALWIGGVAVAFGMVVVAMRMGGQAADRHRALGSETG